MQWEDAKIIATPFTIIPRAQETEKNHLKGCIWHCKPATEFSQIIHFDKVEVTIVCSSLSFH